ncbi:MAG: MoaD/ThiS family protein [Bacteroidota bacterium]
MSITVKYFGVIAEKTGITEESLDLKATGSEIQSFKGYCVEKYKDIKGLTFQIAVNQVLTTEGVLKDGDEVALLPPFSGG